MNLRIHILILTIWSVNLNAQTVLYDDPDGESHTNTDMPITDVTPTVDITNCTSIEFSIDYEFPVGWEGSGNMEYLDECCASCAGDPENSLDPPCLQNMSCTGSVGCWDFMWIQFFIDGDPVIENLIGDSGTTDAESLGTFSYIQCLDGNEEAHIEIVNHNSAASETNIYTNVPAGRAVLGSPAVKIETEMAIRRELRRLPRLAETLRELQKTVTKLVDKG